jgi:hypothetical protein
VVIVVGVIAASAAVPAATGCTTHQCDTDCVWVGATAPANCSQGYAPDANLFHVGSDEVVWESSPVQGTWIDFPGGRTYTFIWPTEILDDLGAGWEVQYPVVSVSTQADNGSTAGAVSSMAAGQLAEITSLSNYGFGVGNASCAEYYIRVEVHVVRDGAGAASPDAGE